MWPGVPQRKQVDNFYTHTHRQGSSLIYLCSSVCISGQWCCAASGTDFGFGAVLGEMSSLVAVSTAHVFASIVSVGHPLHPYRGTFVFIIDLSLEHTELLHH